MRVGSNPAAGAKHKMTINEIITARRSAESLTDSEVFSLAYAIENFSPEYLSDDDRAHYWLIARPLRERLKIIEKSRRATAVASVNVTPPGRPLAGFGRVQLWED